MAIAVAQLVGGLVILLGNKSPPDTVDQCCLPIDLYHTAKIVAELDNGEYSE
jgi:hypothetical protein